MPWAPAGERGVKHARPGAASGIARANRAGGSRAFLADSTGRRGYPAAMANRPIPAAAILIALALLPAACGDRFSPDVYATRAVQQADKVEQGIIVGVRQVRVSAEGSTGAATGAAAGGVIGAQAPGSGIISALGGVGGALVGGLLGKGAEHTVVDTSAYEYIVRTSRNELMRVTQQDREPLRRGQQVLLIMGSQARVVPDYTLPPVAGGPAPAAGAGPDTGPGQAEPAPPPVAVGAGQAEAEGRAHGAAAAGVRSLLPAELRDPGSGAAERRGLVPGAAEALPPLPAYPALPPAPPPPRTAPGAGSGSVDTAVTRG